MNATVVKPIIPDDVREFVAAHEAETVFHGLLDGLPEVFPELRSITCEYDPGVPDGIDEMDPMVLVMVEIPEEAEDEMTPLSRWSRWMLARHTGRELGHFAFWFLQGGDRR